MRLDDDNKIVVSSQEWDEFQARIQTRLKELGDRHFQIGFNFGLTNHNAARDIMRIVGFQRELVHLTRELAEARARVDGQVATVRRATEEEHAYGARLAQRLSERISRQIALAAAYEPEVMHTQSQYGSGSVEYWHPLSEEESDAKLKRIERRLSVVMSGYA